MKKPRRSEAVIELWMGRSGNIPHQSAPTAGRVYNTRHAWSSRPASNQRPEVYETPTLSAELRSDGYFLRTGTGFVGVVGSGAEGRRVGIAGVFSDCGPDGTRTGIGVGLVGMAHLLQNGFSLLAHELAPHFAKFLAAHPRRA